MLDNLDRPVAELDALTTAELRTIQDQLSAAKAKLKQREETYHALLLRRFEKDMRAAYKASGKDTGTVRFPAPGSNLLDLKIEVDKTVVWDQTLLPPIFNAMKPEDARHYAKLTYAVAEDVYKAAVPEVKKKLQTARTLKAGKPKFTFVEREPAAEPVREAA
jgi:hypothetical protein